MWTDRQMDRKMDKRTGKRTNKDGIIPIFERNLAMMVIYVPVKYEFDWTNCFRVGVRKQKCGQTDGWTNGQKWTNEQTEFH